MSLFNMTTADLIAIYNAKTRLIDSKRQGLRAVLLEHCRLTSQATKEILDQGMDFEEVSERVQKWRENASDLDKTAGLIFSILVQTEDPDSEEGWTKRAQARLWNALLIDGNTVAAALNDANVSKHRTESAWMDRVSYTLAEHVHAGPRRCAFIAARTSPDMFAGTTRLDRENVGLPGGKNDPGETLQETALRESQEEGWDISTLDQEPFHVQIVNKEFVCAWYASQDVPKMKEDYLEKGRITPLPCTFEDLAKSKLGNENALPKFPL